MPGKMARSTPQPPFVLPDALVAVLTSLLSCRTAGYTRTFTPVWESFGNPGSLDECHGLRRRLQSGARQGHSPGATCSEYARKPAHLTCAEPGHFIDSRP